MKGRRKWGDGRGEEHGPEEELCSRWDKGREKEGVEEGEGEEWEGRAWGFRVLFRAGEGGEPEETTSSYQQEKARRVRILAAQVREGKRLDWKEARGPGEGYRLCKRCGQRIDLSREEQKTSRVIGGVWVCWVCAGPFRRGAKREILEDEE